MRRFVSGLDMDASAITRHFRKRKSAPAHQVSEPPPTKRTAASNKPFDCPSSLESRPLAPSPSLVPIATPQLAFTHELLAQAVAHLSKDARLAPVIAAHGGSNRLPLKMLPQRGNSFRSLARAIVFQQLADSAARVIYGRFLTAVCGIANPANGNDDDESLTPEAVLATPLPDLRACGLSERKASYVLGLARHFQQRQLTDAQLAAMEPAQLADELTAVKGIGLWTVDMFSMFHLGRPDVLPVGDLGVRRGVQSLFGLSAPPSPEKMEELTQGWRPFRSVRTRLLQARGATLVVLWSVMTLGWHAGKGFNSPH